jgi:hypothetical protein
VSGFAEFLRKAEAANKNQRKPQGDEEHRIQVECVKWFRLQYPKLRFRLFAVPNGGQRNVIVASKMKAEGVLSGVADLILLKPKGNYAALLIEMKTKRGRQSPTQKQWEADLCKDGEYKYVLCRSVEDFISATKSYLAAY